MIRRRVMPKVTKHAPGAPSWTDLSTTDDGAAAAFYGSLFGWTDDPQEMGPDAVYRMQRLDSQLVAGIYQLGPEEKAQNVPPHWNIYFAVENADEAVTKAKAAGGTILMGPHDVFDAGRMAVVQDPQGAVFNVWQPNQNIGSEVMQEPGTITWVELMTGDTDQAIEFYKKVLPIETGKMAGPMPYTMVRAGGNDVAGMMNISDMGPEAAGVPPNWSIYFGSADTDRTVEQARSLGAAVMVEPRDIPSIGRFAVLRDPQGAVFSVFQPAH
jgi:predicted enzyme related to lactoylglutathione lyase